MYQYNFTTDTYILNAKAEISLNPYLLFLGPLLRKNGNGQEGFGPQANFECKFLN